MGAFPIVLTGVFSSILCLVEIPKMLKNKEYKELAVFLAILCFGTVIAVLKSLDMNIPNPADLIAAIYSPVVDLMKGVLE